MKTLAVRMQHHNASALKIAEFLANHSRILQVNYPGLESHPSYQRNRNFFDGFSGMLSFEIEGGTAAADHFMQAITLPAVAPSLGGVETLITRPATTSHCGLTPEEREAQGVSDSLIRLSIGLENTDDLIADFHTALSH
jgi:cystathionine beta-lyase/cystathionine gamma-synthase